MSGETGLLRVEPVQERRGVHQWVGQLHLHLPGRLVDREELRKTGRPDIRIPGRIAAGAPAEARAHPAALGNVSVLQGKAS